MHEQGFKAGDSMWQSGLRQVCKRRDIRPTRGSKPQWAARQHSRTFQIKGLYTQSFCGASQKGAQTHAYYSLKVALDVERNYVGRCKMVHLDRQRLLFVLIGLLAEYASGSICQ